MQVLLPRFNDTTYLLLSLKVMLHKYLFLRLKLFSLSVRRYIHRSQAVQFGNQIWALALHFLPTWAECILAISRSSSVIELKWNKALSELDKVLNAARREAKPKCFIATHFLSRILKWQYSFTLLIFLYYQLMTC